MFSLLCAKITAVRQGTFRSHEAQICSLRSIQFARKPDFDVCLQTTNTSNLCQSILVLSSDLRVLTDCSKIVIIHLIVKYLVRVVTCEVRYFLPTLTFVDFNQFR